MLRLFSSQRRYLHWTPASEMNLQELMEYCLVNKIQASSSIQPADLKKLVLSHQTASALRPMSPSLQNILKLSQTPNPMRIKVLNPPPRVVVPPPKTNAPPQQPRLRRMGLPSVLGALHCSEDMACIVVGEKSFEVMVDSDSPKSAARAMGRWIQTEMPDVCVSLMPVQNEQTPLVQALYALCGDHVTIYPSLPRLMRLLLDSHKSLRGAMLETLQEGCAFMGRPLPEPRTLESEARVALVLCNDFWQKLHKGSPPSDPMEGLSMLYCPVVFRTFTKAGVHMAEIYVPDKAELVNVCGADTKQLARNVGTWLHDASKKYGRLICLVNTQADVVHTVRGLYCDALMVKSVPSLPWSKGSLKELWLSWIEVFGNSASVKKFVLGSYFYQKLTLKLPPIVASRHLPRVAGSLAPGDNWDAVMRDEGRLRRETALLESHQRYMVFLFQRSSLQQQKVTLIGNLSHDASKSSITIHHGDKTFPCPNLSNVDVIIGHDLEVYLSHLWGSEEFDQFVARGGRVWCTKYAEHVLEGRLVSEGLLSLSDLRQKYLPVQMWCKKPSLDDDCLPKQTATLETDLLRVRMIAELQMKRAVESRQMISLSMTMSSLLATAEITWNGYHVDKEVLQGLQIDTASRIKWLESQLMDRIPPSQRKKFSFSDIQHIRSFFLGGYLKTFTQSRPTLELLPPLDPTAAVEIACLGGALTAETQTQRLSRTTNDYLKPYCASHNINVERMSNETILSTVRNAVQSSSSLSKFRVVIAAVRHEKNGINHYVLYDPASSKFLKVGSLLNNKYCWIIVSVNSARIVESLFRSTHSTFNAPNVFYCDALTLMAGSVPLVPFSEELDKGSPVEDILQRECIDLWQGLSRLEGGILAGMARSVGSDHDAFLARPCVVQQSSDLPGILSQEDMEHYQKSVSRNEITISLKWLDLWAPRYVAAAQLKELISHRRSFPLYFDKVKGLTAFVSPKDSCIRAQYRHTSSATGRLTAVLPPIMSLSKDSLRRAFTSRHGTHGLILEFDYKMLEIIVLSILSEDANMLEDVRKGIDIHCRNTTVLLPGKTYEEVHRAVTVEHDPEIIEWRRKAKQFAFQRIYGSSMKSLVRDSDLSMEQVKTLIESENKRYPGIRAFMQNFRAQVERLEPRLQRSNVTDQGVFRYRGEGRIVTGTRFIFDQTPSRSPHGGGGGGAYYDLSLGWGSPTLQNYPVQGLAAEIFLTMYACVTRHVVAKKRYGNKGHIVGTVHDSIILDTHRDVMEDVANDVYRILTNVAGVFGQMYPELKSFDVPFPVEVKVGRTWGEMKPLSDFLEQKEVSSKS